MSYKNNNASNRDALFGGSSKKGARQPGGGKGATTSYKSRNASNRDLLFGSVPTAVKESKKAARPRPARPSEEQEQEQDHIQPNTSRGYDVKPSKPKIAVSATVKLKKIKEAEKFRDQATKAMQKGLFTRPDPLSAASYYMRAADLYGQAGENRLERLHRVASADCQRGLGSHGLAALQYMRAAELVHMSDESIELKRKEGNKLYMDAAVAFQNCHMESKAAKAQLQAAKAFTWGDDSTLLGKDALKAMEVAVEAHVPDVLNAFRRHRQTGISNYADPSNPDAEPTQDVLLLAKDHIVTEAYSHEALQDLANLLIHYGEYPSALYATGAASYLMENDGVYTISLSRSFIVETVLQLAMGDPVAAEKTFLDRHVQSTNYLHSRECKLAEELVRAVLNRNEDDLEEARSPHGSNKSAMTHLSANVRTLVQRLRISGAARRKEGGLSTRKDGKSVAPDDSRSGVRKPTAARAALDGDSSDEEDLVVVPKTATKTPKDVPKSTAKASDAKKEDDDSDDDGKLLDTDKMEKEMDDLMAGLDELGDLGHDDDEGLDEFDDDDLDLR